MSANDLPIRTEGLIEIMKRRADGDWSLLATAAGEVASVSTTMQNLSSESLASSTFVDSSVAFRRVEALAAFDIVPLILIAEHWPRYLELQPNGSTRELGGFVEAWRAALRFFPKEMQRQVLDGAVPAALEEEKMALLGSVPDFDCWEELIVFVENAESYAELRMTDRAQFPATPFPNECLCALLDVPLCGRWGPFESLRVLRRVTSLLDDLAKSQVLDLAGVAWTELPLEHTGHLILHELAQNIDPDAWMMELAVGQVARALKQATDPLPLLRAAYVVASTGFMTP